MNNETKAFTQQVEELVTVASIALGLTPDEAKAGLARYAEKEAKIAILEMENALYAADAKRCWDLMPHLKDTPDMFELHEAVEVLVKTIEKLNQTKV